MVSGEIEFHGWLGKNKSAVFLPQVFFSGIALSEICRRKLRFENEQKKPSYFSYLIRYVASDVRKIYPTVSKCGITVKHVKQPLSKRPKIGFQDQAWLNAGQKYCRMLQREHSAILVTFIKLPFVIKIFVLSIFKGCFTQILLYSTFSILVCENS